MNGGEISGNTVFGGGNGGGVYLTGNNSFTFTMSGGEIFGNTVSGSNSSGAGVYVGPNSIFKKQSATGSSTSGIIYGYAAGDPKSNTVVNDVGVVQDNKGHAIAAGHYNKRETTAGVTQRMDSEVAGAAGGWE
jgi:hypothetical protein